MLSRKNHALAELPQRRSFQPKNTMASASYRLIPHGFLESPPDHKQPNALHLTRARFEVNDLVTIYSLEMSCIPKIEGTARIIRPIDVARHLFCVEFTGERCTRTRLVYPGDWQTNPDRMLAALVAHWRLGLSPELRSVPFDGRLP